MDASLVARVETLEKKLRRAQALALAMAVTAVSAAVFACNREPPSPTPSPSPPVLHDGETMTLTRGRATLVLAGDRIVMDNPASESSVELLSDPPRLTLRQHQTVQTYAVHTEPLASSTVAAAPPPVPTLAIPALVPTLPPEPRLIPRPPTLNPPAVPTVRKPPQLGF